jgi:uncharacterized protein (DUF486 family)
MRLFISTFLLIFNTMGTYLWYEIFMKEKETWQIFLILLCGMAALAYLLDLYKEINKTIKTWK